MGNAPSQTRATLSGLESDAKQFLNEGREIRTPNLLIWSQTRCRCAIPPLITVSFLEHARLPSNAMPAFVPRAATHGKKNMSCRLSGRLSTNGAVAKQKPQQAKPGAQYIWPGSNWRPSACEADVIATRPQMLCLCTVRIDFAKPTYKDD